MAQPPYAYPPQQAGVHHTVIVQNPQQVYVKNQPKSVSERVAGEFGGAFASAFRSGGQLVKGSGSAARSLGGAAAGVVKSGANMAGDAAKGYIDERDRTAKSPLLDCFMPGSGIQLMSKPGQGCLRCLPDGSIDGRGVLGHDYSCHWLVVNRWENKVILRNGAFPQFHLASANGIVVATGIGDQASSFKLHESSNRYVSFEHDMTKHYVAIDYQQNLVPASNVTYGSANSLFEVHLVYSPTGHIYKPTH